MTAKKNVYCTYGMRAQSRLRRSSNASTAPDVAETEATPTQPGQRYLHGLTGLTPGSEYVVRVVVGYRVPVGERAEAGETTTPVVFQETDFVWPEHDKFTVSRVVTTCHVCRKTEPFLLLTQASTYLNNFCQCEMI